MEKNRKSQTEIMGLVIIVLLISIGLLFYVKFALVNKEPNLSANSANLQKAIFIAGAISKVEICDGNSLQKSIEACDGQEQVCSQDACELIKNEVPKIIKAVLGNDFIVADSSKVDPNANTKMFSFNVTQKDNQVVYIGKCPSKKGIVGSYSFRSDTNNKEYTINYKLC